MIPRLGMITKRMNSKEQQPKQRTISAGTLAQLERKHFGLKEGSEDRYQSRN